MTHSLAQIGDAAKPIHMSRWVAATVSVLLALATQARAVSNDAVFVRQSPPLATMFVDQTAEVWVTMRNTGTATWTQAGAYILVPVNPLANVNWGVSNVQLASGDSIGPNQEHTFNFTITTPAVPGTYVFRWQMHQYAYGTYFGALTPEVVIQVREAGCSVSRFTIAADADEETFQKQSAGAWPPTGTTTQQNDAVVNLQQRSVSGGTATMAVTSARWLTGNTIPASATITGASLGAFIGATSSANGLKFAADWVTANDNAPAAADYVQNLTRSAFGSSSTDAVLAQSPTSGAVATGYFQLNNPAANVDRAANGWTKLIFGIMPSSGTAAPTGANYHFGRPAEWADTLNEGALTLDVYWCAPLPTRTPVKTPTPLHTFTVTKTPTPTPTAEADCHYTTFRVLTPEDDGYMSKIDPDGDWPPQGGSGLVPLTGAVILAEGASNVFGFHVLVEDPVRLPWPRVLDLAAPDEAWEVWNVAVNDQTAVNMTMLAAPPPWIELEPHSFCENGEEASGQPSNDSCSAASPCPTPDICTYGGSSGLASDLIARNPDAVILTPESNDAFKPWEHPDEITVTPKDIVDALIRQCELVEAHDAQCIVPTMHKPPYVADVPATNTFINEVNEILRDTFPPTHVVDFDTASSYVPDYDHAVGNGFNDRTHIGARLHEKRASRVLAALTQTTFADTAPILETEVRKWNGTSGRSVAFVRFDTGALPDDAEIRRATLEVFSNFAGAPGGGFAIRQMGIQWANDEAGDDWTIADWPTTLTPNAYSGPPSISEWQERWFSWSFDLSDESNVSRTDFTGFFIYIKPDTGAAANQYFTNDLVSFDAVTGPEEAGDQAPKLTVYYCDP